MFHRVNIVTTRSLIDVVRVMVGRIAEGHVPELCAFRLQTTKCIRSTLPTEPIRVRVI